MAEILVRNLKKKTVDELKRLARMNGRSLQAQTKIILEEATREPKVDMETARKMALELQKKFNEGDFPDSVELIRESRDAR